MTNLTSWISLLPIALILAASCTASAAPDGAGLSPEQEHALRALARGQAFAWPGVTPGQTQALHAKAQAYWDLYERYHLPHGLNADVWWHDYDRATIYRLEGVGDSAAWTGHYLAALALRYHLEPDATLLARINAVLDKFDLLTAISGPRRIHRALRRPRLPRRIPRLLRSLRPRGRSGAAGSRQEGLQRRAPLRGPRVAGDTARGIPTTA